MLMAGKIPKSHALCQPPSSGVAQRSEAKSGAKRENPTSTKPLLSKTEDFIPVSSSKASPLPSQFSH
jgi:hypothetical protein